VNKVSNYTSKGGGLEFSGSYNFEEPNPRNFVPPLLLIDPYTDPKDPVQSKKWIIGKNLTKLHTGLLPFKVRTNGEVYVPPGYSLHVITADWGGDEYFGGNPDLSALFVNIACTKISEDKNIKDVALTFYNPSWERGGKFETIHKLVRSQELSTTNLYRQMVGIMAPKQKLDEKERDIQREKELSMDVFERVQTRFKDWKKECRKIKEANKRNQKIMMRKIEKQNEREKLMKERKLQEESTGLNTSSGGGADAGNPSPRGRKSTHLRAESNTTPPRKQQQ